MYKNDYDLSLSLYLSLSLFFFLSLSLSLSLSLTRMLRKMLLHRYIQCIMKFLRWYYTLVLKSFELTPE